MIPVKKRAKADAQVLNWNIHICSQNNFPTAAGLASSAAGYSCFVFALAQLYNVQGDISAIARQGSGSACRSIFGGWVNKLAHLWGGQNELFFLRNLKNVDNKQNSLNLKCLL